MIKKILIAIAVVAILVFVLKPVTYPLPANLTYYWGDGCPHCKIVEDFISTWDKKDIVKIDKKEVWNNVANAKELKARYEYCKVPQSQMGVPLLFTTDGKCFSGDTPIIDYLKKY